MRRWTAVTLLALPATLWLAWWTLVPVNFGYGLWYELLAIDATIAEYAPQNRYRQHFAVTDRGERERLFAAIVHAVHHEGVGLATLRYHTPDGRVLGLLLREPEIGHLQDVADLLDGLLPLGGLTLLATLLLSGGLLHWGIPPPSLGMLALRVGVVIGGVILAVLLIGPTRLFYAFHHWVFPPDHPWFFYYQDSLMTTLMQAPNLFGAIAVALCALMLLYLGSLLSLWGWWGRRLSR